MVAGVLCVLFVDVLVFYFVISWYWVSTKVSQDSGSDEYQWSTTASVGHLAAGCLSRVSLLGAYWFTPLCLQAHPPSLIVRLTQHAPHDF